MTVEPFEGKRVLVTGGTGSLGRSLVRRLLAGDQGDPESIVVFSRDEAKQHQMRLDYHHRVEATDEIIYHNFQQKLRFWIGDVRDYDSVAAALRGADIVINAAALKQVPTCEYFPLEAVRTNIAGPENIVKAIESLRLPVETVVGVSTDKACNPVNVMGMTKALQERVFVQANMRCPETRFVCVRYGNVLASRGSVVPLFREQIRAGGPVTITSPAMTRFLLSLSDAHEVIFSAVAGGRPGETWVPRKPSALITRVAAALIGDRAIDTETVGVRPGEKVHEVLVNTEEASRTTERGDSYVIQSMLPEVAEPDPAAEGLAGEFSSADHVLSLEDTADLLDKNGFLADEGTDAEEGLIT